MISIKSLLLIVLSMAAAGSALAFTHSEQYLSRGWEFSRDGQQWQSVTVPHDWAIGGPFDKKWDMQVVAIKENGEEVPTEHTGRSGALPWIGKGEYRRTFTVPAGAEHVELVFDGAMADPVVTVNGHEAGHWAYGYNAFRVDVTPYLTVDGSPNELHVALENLEESNRWYPGGGIYRPVKLVITDARALDYWGLATSTVSIGDHDAVVDVRHRLLDDADPVGTTLRITIADRDGRTVAQSTSTPDGVGEFHTMLTVNDPHLWSPESPYLYKLTATLMAGGETLDEQQTRIGIRTIAFDAEHGFRLNGVTRKFRGVCLHHDLGPLGAAVNKAALARQLLTMKAMGADAIRTSHNMPSTWQMELCDSLGLMVMAESFDAWSDPKVRNGYNRLWNEWWRRDITNLILNHRNHPSIVMWSVGNEIPEQWKTEGAHRYRDLVALCHELDPTRPVTCGMDQPEADIYSGFAMMADVPGFNYRVHLYEPSIKRLPQGFLLGSETASTVSTRGHYVFPDTVATNKAWPDGQCSSYDVEYCWWSNLPDDDWHMQDDFDWTIGEFVWTGFDYLGEPTPYDGYWPSRSSYFGICDLAGLPKDRYWLYRSHWNTAEHTIHLLPHWTWPGREGQVTPVYCYTDYPEAELFVNGHSQGRIHKDETSRLDRYRLRWRDVRYEPGEVRVVVYDDDGNVAGERIMRTAGRPARIQLDVDRSTLRADGDDLAFITVGLVDRDGTLCPDADDQMVVEVSGAASLRGLCNGDATSLESFTGPSMRLFHGQLVAVVQAGDRPGNATVTVRTAKGKLRAKAVITVQ